MKDSIVLTLDFGTQSVRAILFNAFGVILGMEKVPYTTPYFSKKPGWFEQEPDFYYQALCEATHRLKKEQSISFHKIALVSVTCFRDTAVLLDENYKPIRPSILWLDQRVAHPQKKVPPLQKAAFFIAGMKDTLEAQRSKTMANWYMEYEPENWKKTKKYVNISTYLHYRLTDQLKDSPSNLTGHYPLDFKRRRWLKPTQLKHCIFQLPDALLCDLVEPGEILGAITKKAMMETGIPEGTPLIAAGSDKSCESLGTGCLFNTIASISYGTASTIEVTNKRYVEPETFLPAYPSALKGYYNSEVQIYRGYWMLNWFKDEFAKEETIEASIQEMAVLDLLNKKMMQIPPGSDGLIVHPYWGPSLKRPNVRGGMIGFSEHHTRMHMYRAIVEGIAFSLKESLETIEKKQHQKVKQLTVSGGGASSSAICQITSDIFGLPVHKVQTVETSALGAAIVGFLTLKIYATPQEAITQMVRIKESYYPNAQAHQQYQYLYKNVYRHLYPKMRKLYKKLRIFSHTHFQ